MNQKKRRKAPAERRNSKVGQNLTRTLLQYLDGKKYSPLTKNELIEQLAIAPVHHSLFESLLHDLEQSGHITTHKERIVLPPKKLRLMSGTISLHAKGFGFVKAEKGPDVFIPKHLTGDAVDGDLVEVEIASKESPKGPEGAVIAILKRGRTRIGGIIIHRTGNHYTAYAPLLGKEKPVLVKSKGHPLQIGDRVVCRVTKWGNEEDFTEGEVLRIIGPISDPSIDVEAAVEEFELPSEFSEEAIHEAKAFGARIRGAETKKRLDLTHLECVTIDPDTAKDFDDAISLTKDDLGHYHLGVHIADVAHYVQSGSILDREAFLRCNSTYFPGKCIPMLPEELSNELCSLKPNVQRLTMSVLAEFDPEGTLIDFKVERTVIKSRKRFTYKEALAVLEAKKKSPYAPLLNRMVELCAHFKKKRYERGSIDFAMADEVILVDENGVPQKMERVEYDITHQMIEEFMLKANELVAIRLSNQKQGLIYRIHEEPNPESFQDFYALARSYGFTLPPNPHHTDIQKLFIQAKETPYLPQLSVSFIRSMKLAAYSPENIGHYGLALEHYCHFTSPIRRYTDLIIQRLLMKELPEEANLEDIATACSEKERLSFKAESSVVLLKKMRLAQTYFEENPTETYPALITKIKPFALFFEVPQFDLEGSLHISKIGNDYYEFNPATLSFRGKRTGKIFAAGGPIYVRIDKINFILRETEWSLVPPPPTHRAARKKS